LVLTACSCDDGDPFAGRLSIASTDNPNEFAPMKAEKLVQASMMGMVFETMVQKQEDGSYEPWLAKTWSVSANKLEWTFNIDPDAIYSNGAAVTAADVMYAFDVGKRHADKDHFSQTKAAWAQIDTIAVVDTKTIKFTLSETFGSFLDSVCSVFIFPKVLWTDKEDLTDANVLFNYTPETDADKRAMLIGSGPMEFYEYIPDQWLWFVRNDDYWKADVKVTEVVIKVYGSSEPAITALKLGEVDALMMLESPTEVSVLRKDTSGDIEVDILREFNHTTFFWLNLRRAPFNLLKVRQAVDMAIDRAEVIEYSQSGYATMPQYAPISAGLPDSHTDLAVPAAYGNTASVAAANALLDAVPGVSTIAAGVDGVRTYDASDGNGAQAMSYNIGYSSTSTGYQTAVDLVSENLADIGIELTDYPISGRTLGYTFFSGWGFWNWDTAIFGYGGGPEFEGLIRQWGAEPWAGNYDASVIGWSQDPNRVPGDGLTIAGLSDGNSRPTTFDTDHWNTATDAEKAAAAAIYTQLKADSAPMIEACQDARRLDVDSAAYHTAALDIQEMFRDELPTPILYHGYFMTAYRTDRFSGWGEIDADGNGGPEGTYPYGMQVPTMSIPTLLSLVPK
jgi:peptide/nickel transport system substrate-binding protein